MASLREVGQMLKEAREGLGLSLDEVGQRTRISVRHLMALEEGNEADLPEIFYVRGFLKKYAEVVGLSPSDVADAYKTAPVHAPTTPSPRASVGPIAYYLLIALVLGGGAALAWQLQPKVTVVAEPSPSPTATPKPTPSPKGPPEAQPTVKPSPATSVSPGAKAASPSPSVFAEWTATDGATTEPASPTPQPTTSVAANMTASPTARPTPKPTEKPTPKPSPKATPKPTAKPTTRPTSRPTPAASPTSRPTPAVSQAGQKQVEIFIQERAWVEVIVDGTVQFEGLLLPGTRRSFRGKAVEVTAGNAGGVRVTVNGKDRGLLGDRGVVVTTTY